jgi:putative ABC transport system permease protein
MLKNFFTIAWRSLLKNRVSSIVNIGGLSIGMSVVILIGLYVWDEMSFDHNHQNHRTLAEVMTNQRYNGQTETVPTVAVPSADAVRNKYSTAFERVALVSRRQTDHSVAWDTKKLSQSGLWVEQDFPEMFTLDMIEGQRTALVDPSSALLTRSAAAALFGNADPLNKIVRVDNNLEFRVAGIFADVPENSTFYGTQILLPWTSKGNEANTSTDWENHKALLFVQSRGVEDETKLNELIRRVPTEHIKGIEEEFLFQPLDKLHLYSQFENGRAAGGLIGYVRLFSMIGLFVLLLACINFMNLSTARSEKRAKEVAIRKTLGSVRSKLVVQFLVESVVIASIAFVFALLMSSLLLPFFNSLSQKNLSMPWGSRWFWGVAVGFTLLTGLVAGSYPALYLSGFRPVYILKSNRGHRRLGTSPERGTMLWAMFVKAGNFPFLLRRMLVVLQFTVSITLGIGTIVVLKQIQYAKGRPAGYSARGLLTVVINTADLRSHFGAIRNELLSSGAVMNMAASSYPTTHFDSDNGMDWEGKDANDPNNVQGFRNVTVTRDFGNTIGWSIVRGRDFMEEYGADSAGAVVNEAAVKVMGFKDPIGRRLKFDGVTYTIIGVVKNMITQSPYEPADPSVFFSAGYLGVITIRVNPELPLSVSLAKMEAVFRTYDPSSPFVYSFNDGDYGKKFVNEERIGKLATSFSLIAILISCLGLFGLASFLVEQRAREIGLRKVLGASVAGIFHLVSKEFLLLVVYSSLIAIPISWYSLHRWLAQYDYRTGISWWIFLAVALGALFVTLLTVSFQALKAANRNPVISLRTE